MECPHCGADTLMGATTCMACGRGMFERPGSREFVDSRTAEPPPFVPSGARDEAEAPTSDEPAVGWDDGPELTLDAALPPPVDLGVTKRRTLCKICFGPCDDAITLVCDICHDTVDTEETTRNGDLVYCHSCQQEAMKAGGR